MALNNARLKGNLKALYQDMENHGDTREDQLDWFCGELAAILIDEIKQLQIMYTNGLTAGANNVIGVINHTVN